MNNYGNSTVYAKHEPMVIPTYVPHQADKNPIFYEKRSYQGACGRTYPLPVTDRLSHKKVDKGYDSITLENEYIKIVVLPEIGGRIHVGLDKTNNYNFIYHNTVIKPALIGLVGPWICGGIEFNWPQHHRPTTFMPLETAMEENPDGSKTVWVGEVEPLYRTKSIAGITVYPGRSYLKVKVRAYNRTPFPQQFMWWANLGVHVNESYRIIFPPDIKYVAFHDRAFVTEWPILKGRYAGLDFKDGLDGTWFKNHFAPGSFMVMDGSSEFDFIAGYDISRGAGVVHVSNHHISSGKKLFTWGNGEFGKGWIENLTDEDGPYVELMAGVYTDNQPDFSWMQPNETRTFEHCWYPIKEIGLVKNATEDAAVSLEVKDEEIVLGYHVTGRFNGSTVVLRAGEKVLLEQKLDINPAEPFLASVIKPEGLEEYQLWTTLYSIDGKELVSYRPVKGEPINIPESRRPSPEPKDLKENEELYIHGLHIEQYRHYALDASEYFLEALRRDPQDIRCNNAMGLLHLKRGLFESAEKYFQKALERLMSRNTNPYDGEPLYNLGLAQKYLGKYKDAYKSFYKASWNYGWKSVAYHSLAEIDCQMRDFEKALFHIEQSLLTNAESIRSRDLKAAIFRKLGRMEEAEKLAGETTKMDLLDYWARFELYFSTLEKEDSQEASQVLNTIMKMIMGRPETYIDIAIEYINAGMTDEAMQVLKAYEQSHKATEMYPMIYYYMGHISFLGGEKERALKYFKKAEEMNSDYCFPSRLESIGVLKFAQEMNPEGPKAWYYLGNLFYDKMRYDEAIEKWEKSREIDPSFAIVHRNLAIAYFEKRKDFTGAKKSMEKAFAANNSDSRLLYELLQLYKNSNEVSLEARLKLLEGRETLVAERDDCYLEMLTLLLQKGLFDEAAKKIMDHVYDIYEGGEGKLVKIHEWIHILKGLECLERGEYENALSNIENAIVLPENYHEKRAYTAGTCHIYYYAGLTAEMAGCKEKAMEYYEKALEYKGVVGESTYYLGMACRKLGLEGKAVQAFNSLIAEGEKLVKKGGRYDFFATGVPTPPPFENDREKHNMSEGLYLEALGHLGLGQKGECRDELEEALGWDGNHLGAWIHSGRCGNVPKYI